MLSIENSSDPSCSSSKASDLVSGAQEDEPQLAPKFSIRDYVFRTRSKDIRTSWPFREQLLQLCLDNGITELLPPLQPRSIVKYNCTENETIVVNGELKDGVELLSSLPLDPSVSISKEKRKLKVRLTRRYYENNDSSLTSHVSSKEFLGEQFINTECRLTEDLVSNLSTVSDPMASKVCPVCKLFTSSSNTTLNAHIDQCLSSNTSKVATQLFKPKMKLRKRRLMVDIYKTASYCTLEDLDRRNGTNWASSLAVLAPANDVDLEPKRPKFSPLEVACKGNVGDIYVDSNGTKLLILSKANDSPPSVLRKSFKLKKHGKGYPASPSCSFLKENMLKPKCSKLMKDNLQSREFNIVKGFISQTVAATEIDHINEYHQEKDEASSHLLDAHDLVKNGVASTLGHWVCSKRSNVRRRLVNNNTNKRSEDMIVTTGKLSFKHIQPNEINSSVQRVCALNLQRSSESAVLTKFKGMNILSQSSKTCKLLGESDCLNVSPQPSSPNESDHCSLKDKKSMASKRSDLSRRACMPLEGMKVAKRGGFVTPKKFKKHRSILACSTWREGERCFDANVASHGSTEDFDLISSSANEASEIHSSNLSENQEECLVMKDPMRSTNLEHVDSISRDEMQVELLTQRSSDNQEVQCEDAISNEVVGQDIQISVDHAEPTIQTEEIQEPDPEKTQEHTLTTSFRVKPTQEHSTIGDTEVSGCSEISNSSLHDNSKDFKAELFSSVTEGKDYKVKSSPSPRESSCSCSESLSLESQLSNPTRKNTTSNVFMKPPTLDYLKSCSQTASNPVLRLMGKDLVVNKEEYVQMPKNPPYGTNYVSGANYISFGVPHNAGFIGYNNYYNYPMQVIGNHQFPSSPLMLTQPQHQPKPMVPSNQVPEVIVIDDDSQTVTMPAQTVQNSNILAPQQFFACIPSQNPYASRAFTSNRRAAPEGSFIFPSPSSLYFTQSLR